MFRYNMIFKHCIRFNKINVKNKSPTNIKHNYDRNKMVTILDNLNKKDLERCFEETKILIKERFGNEIAENITSKELADDLLFLHRWYIKGRVENTKDLISLRTNIKHIYNMNRDLPDSIHNLLINILKDNKAITD